jgi:hypothetical protein
MTAWIRTATLKNLVLKTAAIKRVVVGTKEQKRSTKTRTRVVYPYATPKRISQHLKSKGGESCSPSTVRRILLEEGWRATRPKVGHNDNDKQYREKRVTFCRNAAGFNCRRMVFSDESTFDSNHHNWQHVWIPPHAAGGKVPTRDVEVNAPCISVWAAIGWNFKSSLTFLSKPLKPDGGRAGLNAATYIRKCLAPNVSGMLAGVPQLLFMHDGHKAHTAKRTSEYLERKGVTLLPDWPSGSGDLNPIEQVWSLMKRRVSDLGGWSVNELKAHIQRVWDELDQATLNKFVLGFEKKRAECIKLRGRRVG